MTRCNIFIKRIFSTRYEPDPIRLIVIPCKMGRSRTVESAIGMVNWSVKCKQRSDTVSIWLTNGLLNRIKVSLVNPMEKEFIQLSHGKREVGKVRPWICVLISHSFPRFNHTAHLRTSSDPPYCPCCATILLTRALLCFTLLLLFFCFLLLLTFSLFC